MPTNSELDLLGPFTDLTVDIVGGVVLAGGAAVWAWWLWGQRKRRELTTPDRHELALKFAAAARQVEILSEHDAELVRSASFEELWPKITRCLDILMDIGYGPAAKIATGNAGGDLSKTESRMAMLMVGSVSQLPTRYAHNLKELRTSESEEGSQIVPCLLGLDLGAKLFRFAGKVFDPTRRTPFGLWRLERRLRKRLIQEKSTAWTSALVEGQ